MGFPIDKIFLVLAIISLPNLYHKAEYNVPLMLFCFAMWPLPYRSLIIYLLVLSWFVDGARLVGTILNRSNEESEEPGIVLVVQIIVFSLKIMLVIFLLVMDRDCRTAMIPSEICTNFKNTFITPTKREQNFH